jgi:hypothetical protein
VGNVVGDIVGAKVVGANVGIGGFVMRIVGDSEGLLVGFLLGLFDGDIVGSNVEGLLVGLAVSDAPIGDRVGYGTGLLVGNRTNELEQ